MSLSPGVCTWLVERLKLRGFQVLLYRTTSKQKRNITPTYIIVVCLVARQRIQVIRADHIELARNVSTIYTNKWLCLHEACHEKMVARRVQEKKKNVQIPKPFCPLHPKELRQLFRHRSVHLGCIKVIEILRAANCLSLGQHLLDVRRELDCPNGIVVKYLAEFRCEPRLHGDVRRTPV